MAVLLLVDCLEVSDSASDFFAVGITPLSYTSRQMIHHAQLLVHVVALGGNVMVTTMVSTTEETFCLLRPSKKKFARRLPGLCIACVFCFFLPPVGSCFGPWRSINV